MVFSIWIITSCFGESDKIFMLAQKIALIKKNIPAFSNKSLLMRLVHREYKFDISKTFAQIRLRVCEDEMKQPMKS